MEARRTGVVGEKAGKHGVVRPGVAAGEVRAVTPGGVREAPEVPLWVADRPAPPASRDALRARVGRLPRATGVYLWKSADGAILYVGKAQDLRARVTSYFDPDRPKTAALMDEAREVDYIVVRNNKEALVLEQTLIKLHRPRYNVRLTDDKQYPFLKLTNEPYPRLLKVHRRDDDGATYFGPFPDGTGAFHVAQAINELIPLRRCRILPKEKCLYLDIGKCAGPCVAACTDPQYEGLVEEVRRLLRGKAEPLLAEVATRLESAAQRRDYETAGRLRDQLRGLSGILERQHMVVQTLEDRDIAAIAAQGEVAVVSIMHQREGKVMGHSSFLVQGAEPGAERDALSQFLRGYYQDRLVPRHVTFDASGDIAAALEVDLRALREGAVDVETPERGAKRSWVEVAQANASLRLQERLAAAQRFGVGALQSVQASLGLSRPPRVIEGLDVSHLAGAHTRAALVRFVDGEPDKSGYRTFGMKRVGAAAAASGAVPSKGKGREVDDFASLHEAVERRIRGLLERGEPLPDLLLLDGGPGQLDAARAALRKSGAVVALCSLAKRNEELFLPGKLRPLRLRRDDAGLQLLQRVRDEAHRFGITQVRRKGVQEVVRSPLDDVKGIGPKRRALLVRAFGGLEGLRTAGENDLVRLAGITPEIARSVLAALLSQPEQSAVTRDEPGDVPGLGS